jgi:glycosyltransferase involved in cell wall biosynthesis
MLVVVHDASAHPGDSLPLQMTLQALLLRRADALIALSAHVATTLAAQRPGATILRSTLPPLAYGPAPPPPGAHGGTLRVLSFGRLLPYKGLDLLAAAWRLLPPGVAELRVVGSGPETPALDALRALPAVTVENRWVPEAEVGALLGWADVLLLSHTEASQSGVAAAARAAGRWVVGTDVGGLAEQLRDDPRAVLCAATPAALAAGLRSLPGRAAPPAPPDTAAAWSVTAAELVRQLQDIVGRA